jgi:hypothetical protein
VCAPTDRVDQVRLTDGQLELRDDGQYRLSGRVEYDLMISFRVDCLRREHRLPTEVAVCAWLDQHYWDLFPSHCEPALSSEHCVYTEQRMRDLQGKTGHYEITENNIEFEFGRSGDGAFCVNGDEAALELPELGAVRLARSHRLP